jgi:ABC-2 type transport system ATP-binding protein
LVLALLNRPRLVILDELTQGLDPAARRGVWAAVQQLRDAGTTVLLVTHELDEAEVLCDRVIAMRAGRILDSGRPADLVARHAGWATVRFSAPPADDRLPDRLRALPGVGEVVLDDGGVTVSGARQIIAQVGAELVRTGRVPADLRVEVANLETALLSLLESPPSRPEPTLIGASS